MKKFLCPLPSRIIFIFTYLTFASSTFAQFVYEPVESEIYKFLERLYLNDVIEYHSEIKPISRGEIAGYLVDAGGSRSRLTSLDEQELNFYFEEFDDEISVISDTLQYRLPRLEFFTSGEAKRFRVFNYKDSSFSFYLDPILGYRISSISGSQVTHRWNGLEIYGYYADNWGFDLSFKDNLETGDNIDRTKHLNTVPGIVLTKQDKNSIQYDDVRASLNFGWATGIISIGKDYINFGNGRLGQIIMSNKAPSFPYIKFEFYPVEWLRFTYFHGWLKSNVPDSSTFRETLVEDRINIADVPKFIASHLISFYLTQDFSISLGESIVYSDHIQPVYFIPVMFFRIADHYLSTEGSSSGNAQIFGDIAYRIKPLKLKLYASVFIDELSIEKVFEGDDLSAIGYTFGGQISDLGISNSSILIEYTRIKPFVYLNSNDAQLYTNLDYQLGHWLGSNGDIFYAAYHQRIIRGLNVTVSGLYSRKGNIEDPEEQYRLPYPSFLYGNKRIEKRLTIRLKYEPFHNVFTDVFYSYSDISDEDTSRTPGYLLGRNNSFSFSLSYGL